MDTQAFTSYDQMTYMQFTNPGLIHKDLETLIGILTGIAGDHIINAREHEGLNNWLNHIKPYEFKQPYKEVVGLLRDAISDNILTEEEIKDIIWYCSNYTTENKYYDDLTAGVQRLHGIVKGIALDHEISVEELSFLDKWLDDNEYLKNTWPYDELYSLTTKVLADKIITPEEHRELMQFFQALSSDYVNGASKNSSTLSIISSGFYQIDPEIKFQEKTFCITGASKRFKRKELAQRIELYGGYVQNKVSSKLNYLIVCDEKNACWAFSCYGRKIEEAMYHRRNGVPLVIVHEFDFFDALESYK